jgi:hypothetical protein
MEYQDLLNNTINELQEYIIKNNIKTQNDTRIPDKLIEIIKNNVPIYNKDTLNLSVSNPNIHIYEPKNMPSGSYSASQVVIASTYEMLFNQIDNIIADIIEETEFDETEFDENKDLPW